MKLSRTILKEAAENGVLSSEQAEQLWTFLSERAQDTPSFRFTHILYYFGGLVAIGAMSLFLTLGWERFGGWGIVFIAACYAGAGLWLTEHLLKRLRLPVPAGIVAAFVVVVVPLAVYGLQAAIGWWDDGRHYVDYHGYLDRRWLLIELAALTAAGAMLLRYRLPFLTLPVALALWYLSVDSISFFLGEPDARWQYRETVSLWTGLLLTLAALLVDVRTRLQKDYAFWIYMVGVIAFWGGLSLTHAESQLHNFYYLLINVSMIVVGAVLARRVFVVFGAIGTGGYVGYLAYDVFRDSMVFPFALAAIGFGIIYLGIVWQRREQAFSVYLRGLLPPPLREFVERRY
ncbi:MAG TPA: DUF2157 domain-containing protein [Candidimonas sp.]|nr:DUF2157 domain-containing protein [Candidimonas sp.]